MVVYQVKGRPNFHSAFPPRTFPTFGFSFAAFADELRFRIQTSGRCRSVQFSSSSVHISQLCFGWQSRKLRANAILPSAANVISGSVRFVRNNVTKRKHFVLGKRASIVWRIFRELLKCDKSQWIGNKALIWARNYDPVKRAGGTRVFRRQSKTKNTENIRSSRLLCPITRGRCEVNCELARICYKFLFAGLQFQLPAPNSKCHHATPNQPHTSGHQRLNVCFSASVCLDVSVYLCLL